jgi:hypothetical protein
VRGAPAIVGIAAALSGGFAGCECEDARDRESTPSTAAALPAAEPIGPLIPGWFCTGAGEAIDPPKGAYRAGPWVLMKRPNWEDPEEGLARFLNLPGVRDIPQEGAEMYVHRLSGTAAFGVLSAKVHEFPEGTTFDAAGAQKAFDDVAANPRAILIGAKAITWGGRPAVEGTVKSPAGVVHHLILPTEGRRALDVIFVAPEGHYHRYLAEACQAAAAAK